MRRKVSFSFVILVIALTVLVASAFQFEDENDDLTPITVHADIVASGIPGAGAIAQIGTFHKGGPFHDNVTLAGFTQPGTVLDRRRILVASTSNFGASLARPGEAPGSILSIDVSSGSVAVPPGFASGGSQATAADGNVILYNAQSPTFLNGVKNSAAVTADRPSVSLPLGISLNNGFGRPWFANAPNGSSGDGTITVTDPGGFPLAGAPDPVAGGVFAGTLTNRGPQSSQGLTAGAVATALITKSPDQSVRAVFFAALADGSIAQVHVQKGVDALMPPGTFTPICCISPANAESADANLVTRVGMIFNWAPSRILYVSDPLANRVLVVDVSDEGVEPQTLFAATNPRYITSPLFNTPIDIAPAVPEVAARNFASNTTLGVGSDIYVLNRGNNTILRMKQSGQVLAVRQISADLEAFRVNGLAVSEDARTIWITATAPGRQGVVLRIPSFGAGASTKSMIQFAQNAGANGAVAQGADMFSRDLNVDQGLGPLFNGRSCNRCHKDVAGVAFPGGMGVSDNTFVTRIARVQHGEFRFLEQGPIARQQSIALLGAACDLPTGVPPQANATSVRSAMTLRGTSLIDNIRIGDIDRVRQAEPDDVRGRFNVLEDGRIGRFGWKAQTPTLVEFVGEALRDETGLTNPVAPIDLVRGCGASINKPEADAVPLTSVVAFLNTIDPPAPNTACLNSAGATVFKSVGCTSCHTPSMPGPGSAAPVFLYSDLLLHEMGPSLADGFVQGSATGSEFRTAPLWRLVDRQHFLHDGRASSILEAIDSHGGQATNAKTVFDQLSDSDKEALLAFLKCI